MGREEQYRGYYHDIFTSHSYVDTRLSIQTAVADFLAQAFFGRDFSRVIYTNPEYSFRKRLERRSNGFKEGDLDIRDERLFLSNLQLPFCSYHLSGAPEIIKTAAASEWKGYYDESIEQRMHFVNTLQKCTVQFFFDRSDDATAAFRIAQRESLAEYPIRYIQEIFWRDRTIPFPVWITVKKVTAGNDSFNETEWLEKAHMFAMTLDLEIEIADIHIHRGLNAVQLPFKWHATGNVDTWETGEAEYYVQKCVLMWANKALNFDISCPSEPTNEAKEIANTILKTPQLTPCDPATILQVQSVLPNKATAEMVEGYFRDATKVLFNRLLYNAEKTTIDDKGEVTAWIDTIVKPATYKFWDYTEIYIPSRTAGAIKMDDCHQKYVQIDGLHPNSTYTVYFIAHDIDGNFNTIPLEFTTPVWKKETLPAVEKPTNPTELVTTIEAKEPEEPTVIRGRGLIGLEL